MLQLFEELRCAKRTAVARDLTISYHPGIRIPKFYDALVCHVWLNWILGKHTTEMGIGGALGKMNLTSSNFCLLLQFSANDIHPAPESPSPCAMITVAVCFFTAGTTRALAEDMLEGYVV